ncbi:MAG: hypothetical protein QXX23_07185 [Thermoplasmata archaeon]
MESTIQTQTPTQVGADKEKEELEKIYRRLGYLQIKVLKLLAQNGGKMFMHKDNGEEPAIGDIVRGCCTQIRHARNTKRVCLSLERWGLVTITYEECPNHKGRLKEFVYLTEKGYKMLEIIKAHENE